MFSSISPLQLIKHNAFGAAVAKKHNFVGISNADELADSYEQLLTRTGAAKPNTDRVNAFKEAL